MTGLIASADDVAGSTVMRDMMVRQILLALGTH